MEDVDDAGHTSRSSCLLEFPSLTSRLAETRRRMVHIAPSWRLRRVQVEDGQVDATGYIEPFNPTFVVFIVLYPMGILVFLVFCLGL
jgi:hypothetical protein